MGKMFTLMTPNPNKSLSMGRWELRSGETPPPWDCSGPSPDSKTSPGLPFLVKSLLLTEDGPKKRSRTEEYQTVTKGLETRLWNPSGRSRYDTVSRRSL